MKKIAGIILVVLSPFLVYAQHQYSRQDSLLGKLTDKRTCYDVKHYELSLRINPDTKEIKGSNTITYESINDFNICQIDLDSSLVINTIKQGRKQLKFKRDKRAVFIDFDKVQKKGSINAITVFYEGKPIVAKKAPWDGGFVWSQDKNKQPWIGVACQNVGASIWYPCKDHWTDKPDSVTLHYEVPKNLMAVGNGKLIGSKKTQKGYKRYSWQTSYPINNYNVTLNIGDYSIITDEYTSQDLAKLALDYYVLKGNEAKALKHFEQVKPMLTCYELIFDKYPFWRDGYALVETPYLGMEHQGAIAYGNRYQKGYMGRDLTQTGIGLLFDFIIIHETGHEYWGNSVTADDKAEMWIHEAFCTYGEALYVECLYGKEKSFTYTNGWKNIVENDMPILAPREVNAEGSGDMYFKGALMLHTIRNVINDDVLWFALIKKFYQEFKGKHSQTKDVIAFFNTNTKIDLTGIFEEYLKYTEIPTFQYKIENNALFYRFEAKAHNLEMPVEVTYQGQKKRLKTTTKWQKDDSIKSSDIQIATDLFYILTQKL
ncbi:MAG: M1 family metallopeptidase [Thermonemataceae bacterium]|nr:M1 family metallopeptidase [Thermonemataceae bacterium]